jgi:hypothetical protein
MEEFTALALRVTFPLTDEVQFIRAAAQKHHVPLGQHEMFIFDPKIKRTGNCLIKKWTMSTYGEHYCQLWRFLAIIGDYESMLMLHVQPTVQVPAMKIQSLQLFLKLKRQNMGNPFSLMMKCPSMISMGNSESRTLVLRFNTFLVDARAFVSLMMLELANHSKIASLFAGKTGWSERVV